MSAWKRAVVLEDLLAANDLDDGVVPIQSVSKQQSRVKVRRPHRENDSYHGPQQLMKMFDGKTNPLCKDSFVLDGTKNA